jgi:hypothetical protein
MSVSLTALPPAASAAALRGQHAPEEQREAEAAGEDDGEGKAVPVGGIESCVHWCQPRTLRGAQGCTGVHARVRHPAVRLGLRAGLQAGGVLHVLSATMMPRPPGTIHRAHPGYAVKCEADRTQRKLGELDARRVCRPPPERL